MTKPLSSLYFERPKYFNSVKDTWQGFPWASMSYFAYARQAFIEGLKQLGVKPGSSILFPEFICRDVLSVASELNAKILFYPVNETFQPALDPSSWPKAEVVLAVNYFGFAQPLAPFEQFAKSTGAIIVEDNAHGFLSKSSDGHWLGTRTDMGIFSFRKTLPIGTGAGLFLKSKKMTQANAALTKPAIKVSLSLAAKDTLAMTLGQLPIAARSIVSILNSKTPPLNVDWMTNDLDPESFVPRDYSADPLLSTRLLQLNWEKEVGRRRTMYERLMEITAPHKDIEPVFATLPQNTCPYMFVFTSQTDESLVRFTSDLLKLGLRYIKWPDLPLTIRNRCPDFYKKIWAVPFMW